MNTSSIAILGAGSWGTAVAIHLASSGQRVLLWGHNAERIQAMQKNRCNLDYLPDTIFPDSLIPTSDLNTCMTEASQIIVAVPSHAFKALLDKLQKPFNGISWLTKGLDPTTNKLISQLIAEKWGNTYPMAIISGPSFAKEVAKNLPTAVVVASNNATHANAIQVILHQQKMRVYLSNDLIGVQLCGAVKNVLAIACGISDGLQYGANAKAALITRGLAEMSRLGTCLGANLETFMGLAGVGDLVLTCTDNQSRNRRFGLLLGQGIDPTNAEKQINQVVEGKHNAEQICMLAHKYHIEMPICSEVNALLKGIRTAEEAVNNLLNRPARDE